MEPLKPEVKKAILNSNPQAEPAEIEEYERLLAQRFNIDPDATPPTAPGERTFGSEHSRLEEIESRIRTLHKKLFPAASNREETR